MRLGAVVLQSQPWTDARSTWQQVEQSGFDVGYVADHLTHSTMAGQWWADGWTTLAAAAQVTARLQLGTLVASAAVRNPAALARAAATLHDLSDGRFVLGLGAGTATDAIADRGVSLTAGQLAGRYSEVVEALRALWAGASTYQGSHVATDGVVVAALPDHLTPPPLLLAAHGPRGYDLVARHADGWSTYGGPAATRLVGDDLWAALAGQLRSVEQACEGHDRDPAGLRRSVLLGYGPDRPLADAATYATSVARARDIGFDEVVVYWPHGERGDRFWADPAVVTDGVARARHEV